MMHEVMMFCVESSLHESVTKIDINEGICKNIRATR